ncbi:hypothetical protein AB4212_15350, partial [Streptomyces sp. 2MCAF27]
VAVTTGLLGLLGRLLRLLPVLAHGDPPGMKVMPALRGFMLMGARTKSSSHKTNSRARQSDKSCLSSVTRLRPDRDNLSVLMVI